MTEQELRTIVRAAIARHAGPVGPALSPPVSASPATASASMAAADARSHFSHGLYASLVNPSETCIIEPAVPCNHCNYCRSHGH